MEFREWLHFMFGWVPLLGFLFPSVKRRRRILPPPKDFPKARVAIIGAGVGGCSAAYFLRQLAGDSLDIHVYSNDKIGGRTRVIEFGGHMYEAGASIIHTSNQYLVDFREEFGLALQLGKEAPTTPFGVFNGRNFVIRTGYCGFFNSIKLLWRYGFSLFQLSRHIDTTLKEFCTIYDLQESGASFRTVPEMLQAMGGNKFITLTQVTAEKYFVNTLGLRRDLVDEMICAALKVNYGQDNNVDGFTALVALAGMQDGSLWRVQNGNKLIPEHALDASKAVYHTANVISVTRKEVNGKLSYTVESTDLQPSEKDSSVETSEYDVVILASPLNLSKIQFHDFPNFIYSTAARTPYHRTVATFIKGQINPELFGLQDYSSNFPLDILTKDMENTEVDFNSIGALIPSDIPNAEVKQYCKPLTSEPTRAWKVFSNAPLTSEDKSKLFREISDEKELDWMAYPEYIPPEEYPSFVLDDGMFYINAIEKAASAMEMSAIGAKNAALLTKEYILAQGKEE